MRRLAACLLGCMLPLLAHGDVSAARQGELLNLLRHDCGSCHGMRLTGGLGPALTAESLAHKPEAFLERTILEGRPGTPMAPWWPFISEEEARWLVERMQRGEFDDMQRP